MVIAYSRVLISHFTSIISVDEYKHYTVLDETEERLVRR